MTPAASSRLPDILQRREGEILERWIKDQLAAPNARAGALA